MRALLAVHLFLIVLVSSCSVVWGLGDYDCTVGDCRSKVIYERYPEGDRLCESHYSEFKVGVDYHYETPHEGEFPAIVIVREDSITKLQKEIEQLKGYIKTLQTSVETLQDTRIAEQEARIAELEKSQRSYTVKEIDELRKVCEELWVFGSVGGGWAGGSDFKVRRGRSYSGSEKDEGVEAFVRTYMIAGIIAEDLYNQDD